MTLIFVYGTLLSGYGNNSILTDQKYIDEAFTAPEFTLVDVGGFPGLIEGGTTSIPGEVYEVSDACIAYLDELEGYRGEGRSNLYERTQVILEDGRKVTTYCFQQYSSSHHKIILSGSWREHIGEGHGHNYCG